MLDVVACPFRLLSGCALATPANDALTISAAHRHVLNLLAFIFKFTL